MNSKTIYIISCRIPGIIENGIVSIKDFTSYLKIMSNDDEPILKNREFVSDIDKASMIDNHKFAEEICIELFKNGYKPLIRQAKYEKDSNGNWHISLI